MLIALNHMVYFVQILHTNACQHYLAHGMQNRLVDGRRYSEHKFRPLAISENVC